MTKLMSKFCLLGVRFCKAIMLYIRPIVTIIIILVVVIVAYIACQRGIFVDHDDIVEWPFIEK